MIVFPAIDLLGGDVVRLERGERSRVSVYARDPRAMRVYSARVADSRGRQTRAARQACAISV